MKKNVIALFFLLICNICNASNDFSIKEVFRYLQEQRITNNDENAIIAADSIIKFGNNKTDYSIIFHAHLSKSEIYHYQGYRELAIKSLINASNYIYQLNDKIVFFRYYRLMGLAYYAEKDYENALKQFYVSLFYAKEHLQNHRDRYWVQNSLDNIGLCYFKLGNYKIAEFYYNQAIEESVKTKNLAGMVIAYINSAKMYLMLNNHQKAIILFDSATQINQRSIEFSYDSQIEITLSLLKIYIESGEIQKSNNQITILNSIQSKFKPKDLADYFYLLALFKEKTRHLNEAYLYLKKYKLLIDSIESKNNVAKLNSQNFANYLEENTQIKKNTLDNSHKQKLMIVYTIIFFTVVIGIYIVNWVRIKSKNNLLKNLNTSIIKEKQKQHELNIQLQNSIDLKDYSIATIAHDIRNPLGSIKLLAEILNRDINDDRISKEEQIEIFNMIHKSALNGLGVISELLESAKLNNIKEIVKTNVDLNMVIDNVLNDLKLVSDEKQISIEVKTIKEPEVNGDAVKLYRILENLISNAIKFSYPKSKIIISLLKEEQEIIVSIKDNGTGIAPEHLNSLFNPFDKNAKQGTMGEKTTGLGLSITKKLVEIHNGRIWVESKLNEGSTFYIALKIR